MHNIGYKPKLTWLSYMTIATVPNPHNQIAQAFQCIGEGSKEYCTGHRDGAIQPKKIIEQGMI
jgi:hypothetical protein